MVLSMKKFIISIKAKKNKDSLWKVKTGYEIDGKTYKEHRPTRKEALEIYMCLIETAVKIKRRYWNKKLKR